MNPNPIEHAKRLDKVVALLPLVLQLAAERDEVPSEMVERMTDEARDFACRQVMVKVASKDTWREVVKALQRFERVMAQDQLFAGFR